MNQWWPSSLRYLFNTWPPWVEGTDWINSLAPGKFKLNFGHVIFKWILVIDGWWLRHLLWIIIWMSLDFTDDRSTLVQVMAWCHQATSHYLSQCWPRSLSPYGITWPQWVNLNLQLSDKEDWRSWIYYIQRCFVILYQFIDMDPGKTVFDLHCYYVHGKWVLRYRWW